MQAMSTFVIYTNDFKGTIPFHDFVFARRKKLQRNDSRERHPNDEHSHGLRDLRKQFRGSTPRERAPSDAG
eukprot:3133148-Amphidinium_carterae.1